MLEDATAWRHCNEFEKMDKIIIKYHDNGLVHYNNKEYLELISKLQRD